MHGGKKMKSSDFKNKMMWGFELARRVAKGSKWHPQNDDLRGTAKYGNPPTNPTSGPTGTMKWDYKKVQYFMFSTGDFSEWYVVGALHRYGTSSRHSKHAVRVVEVFEKMRSLIGGSQGFLPSTQ